MIADPVKYILTILEVYAARVDHDLFQVPFYDFEAHLTSPAQNAVLIERNP